MNIDVKQILQTGHARAEARGLGYYADLTPTEAYDLLQAGVGAVLVDVRTEAEMEFVGRVPGAVEVPIKHFPGMQANPDFSADVKAAVKPAQYVMFLCRSGVRSIAAAQALTDLGYAYCINILEGFEGDKNAAGQRRVNGWKMAKLPWVQG